MKRNLSNRSTMGATASMLRQVMYEKFLESDVLSALIHLEQSYSNAHSPQHRQAALMNARAVIARAKGKP